MQILHKAANLKRALVVSERDRVDSQAAQFLDEADQSLKVLLNGDVKGIAVLEVDGNYEPPSAAATGHTYRRRGMRLTSHDLADLLNRKEPPRLGVARVGRRPATQPDAEQEGKDDVLDVAGPQAVVPGNAHFSLSRTGPQRGPGSVRTGSRGGRRRRRPARPRWRSHQ